MRTARDKAKVHANRAERCSCGRLVFGNGGKAAHRAMHARDQAAWRTAFGSKPMPAGMEGQALSQEEWNVHAGAAVYAAEHNARLWRALDAERYFTARNEHRAEAEALGAVWVKGKLYPSEYLAEKARGSLP